MNRYKFTGVIRRGFLLSPSRTSCSCRISCLRCCAAVDGDEGAIGDEGGDGGGGKRSYKFFTVKGGDVGAEFVGGGGPDFPAGMFDAVLTGTIGAPPGVAPVMFGDEFFVRTGGDGLRFAAGRHSEVFPFVPGPPFIARAYFAVAIDHFAAHGQRLIRFAVKDPRGDGDGRFRHQLANENDAAPPDISASRTGSFADVKAKVYFLEVAVSRNGQTAHDGMIEEEADDAEVRLALEEIELGSGGQIRRKQLRRHPEIEHGEITPVRGEERLHVAK